MKRTLTKTSTSATVLGRRDVLKSAAALLAATAAPALGREAIAQSKDQSTIVFSDTNAVVETNSGRIRGYTERGAHQTGGTEEACAMATRIIRVSRIGPLSARNGCQRWSLITRAK